MTYDDNQFPDWTNDLAPAPDWLTGTPLPDLPFPDGLLNDTLPVPADDALTALVADLLPELPMPDPMPAITPPPRFVEPIPPPAVVEIPSALTELRLPASVDAADDGQFRFSAVIAPPAGVTWAEVSVSLLAPKGYRSGEMNRKPKVSKGTITWTLGEVCSSQPVPLTAKFPYRIALEAYIENPPPFVVTYRVNGKSPVREAVPVPPGTQPRQPLWIDPPSAAFTLPEVDFPPPPAPDEIELPSFAEADAAIPAVPTAVAPMAPELAVRVTVTTPAAIELDSAEPFRVTVTNGSGKPCRISSLYLTVPAQLTFDSSDGTYWESRNRVEWVMVELEPWEERTVTAWFRGYLPGTTTVTASAVTSAAEVTASASTNCDTPANASPSSLPAVLAELDRDDTDTDERKAVVVGERHVLFRMGNTTYAAPIGQLREVIRPPAVTPVPNTPGWLLGLANVRGDVVSIISFPEFLGVAEDDSGKRSVLVTQSAGGGTEVGFQVDEVIGIRRMEANPWAADEGGDERLTQFLTGLGEHRDRLVPVFDLNRVLASPLVCLSDAA